MEVYCIRHGEMVYVPAGAVDHECLSCAMLSNGAAVIQGEFCRFEDGFAFCPPPEEFFIVGQCAMSQEEIDHLNSVATELLTDWS